MANCLPFNAVYDGENYDRVYKAEDWAWYFATFIANGIFPKPSDGLQVIAYSGMEIKVNAGFAFINGYAFKNPASHSIRLDMAEGALNRVDRVVVRWDLPQRDIYIAVLKGTPSAKPQPTAVTRSTEIWELALADIYVGKGVTKIQTKDITDQRFNSSVCGIVTGTVGNIYQYCPNPYVYNTTAHTWDEFRKKISGGAAAPTTDKLYRVRKSWEDAASQLGAFEELENAKKACKAGYTVYDWNGKAVYPKTSESKPDTGNVQEKEIWDFFTKKGLNAYAVAGLMGNLFAESGLNPCNLQNTYNNKLGMGDEEYTKAVDAGSYGNFVNDSAGYGLAQWTFYTRKQELFDYAKAAGVSIGNLAMQLAFLWEELKGYKSVMDTLKNATSVRAASDAVLTGYEKPADQSENVKKQRAGYGDGYYRKYAGGAVAPAIKKLYRVRKSWKDAASQLGAFEELENAKKACKEGYTVYDWDGKAVYSKQTTKKLPYKVQIDVDDLRIRTGAGIGYAVTGEYTGRGVFTIVEEKAGKGSTAGWGKLKSGAGWVSLDYCTKLV